MSSLCYAALFFAAASCLVSADLLEYATNISPEKADIMFDCMDLIACDMRREYEIKRMISQAGPKLFGETVRWLSECYVLDPSDPGLFWDTYADRVCNQSVNKRRECTKECLLNFANYYEARCEEDMDIYECPRAEATASEVIKIFEEYTESGHCNNGQKQADEVGEMITEVKPPGFG